MTRLSITQEKVKIDVKDRKIIAELAEDCRTPLSTIAKNALLSRDAVDYRIKRLTKDGVIKGFYPVIDYKKLGYYIYHVFLLVDEVSKERQNELYKTLKEDNCVVAVMEYSDKWDIEVSLLAKNIDEFDDFITKIMNKFPELIIEKIKLGVIKNYVNYSLPKRDR